MQDQESIEKDTIYRIVSFKRLITGKRNTIEVSDLSTCFDEENKPNFT